MKTVLPLVLLGSIALVGIADDISDSYDAYMALREARNAISGQAEAQTGDNLTKLDAGQAPTVERDMGGTDSPSDSYGAIVH